MAAEIRIGSKKRLSATSNSLLVAQKNWPPPTKSASAVGAPYLTSLSCIFLGADPDN
jgi:hypothetical protein